MSVSSSNLLPVGSLPTTPEQVWTPAFFLSPQWSAGVALTSSWKTEIFSAASGAERRVSQVSKPSRLLTFTTLSLNRSALWGLLDVLNRITRARSVWPLYCDRLRLTAAYTTGTTLTVQETAYRRLFPGQRVLVVSDHATTISTTFSIGIIASVGATTITLVNALTGSYAIGDRVYPLFEADPAPQISMTRGTDDKVDLRVTLRERVSQAALDVTATSGWPVTSQDGYPVLWHDTYFSRSPTIAYDSSVAVASSGSGGVLYDSQPKSRIRWNETRYALTRSSAWDLIKLFDIVRGSAQPLIIVPKLNTHTVTELTATTVKVLAYGDISAWNRWTHLVVSRRSTNLPYVVPISGVSRLSNIDTVSVPGSMFTDHTDVRFVSPAVLARFETDELTEDWSTEQHCGVSTSFIELLNEKVVA